ncbi:MAG: efflux RND transporter periplasmic adaptor subunit [Deltaproteobacteria bacterium HGW-Deltaproteobacteria-8]|nr:MAG: efflux RND transporter periplasmic adaptor subunit [Deltaproteobacteria bacterium HGW-Deltaproteobacteria-8]
MAAALVLVLAGGAYLFFRNGKQAESYRTAKPTRGEIISTVTSSGNITPVVSVSVGAAVSGTIKELFVDFNSPVKKGQIIAQIDPATFRAQVEQSKGNYLAAQANMEKAKVTLADTTRTMNRYKDLVKDGSVSVSDYDTYATAAASARAALGAAQGTVAQARGSFDQAKTNLDYATIRSPVDGIVISRAVDVGQTVAASFTTPTLFTIAQDLTKMQIYATVDESDIGKVKEGGNATFTVDAYPESNFSGVVTQVRNAATTVSNVVTYTVVVGVDNSDLKLKPGMTANVTFITAKKTDALKIPTSSLRFRPKTTEAASDKSGDKASGKSKGAGGKKIYILKGGKAEPVIVTLGIGNDKETEVTGGELPADAEVIIEAVSNAGKNGASKSGSAGGPPMGPRL